MSEKRIVSLGKPITAPALIPVMHSATPMCINEPFMVEGGCYKVTAISFGSPHGAVFVDDISGVDIAKIGSALSSHRFPKGASIVFVQILDKDNLKARVWQNNTGEVDFTEEAAAVAGVAAMMLQKTLKSEINAHMGGTVTAVKWDRGSNEVMLSISAVLEQQKPLIKKIYKHFAAALS